MGITKATLLDLADRPGEIAGIGPVDPDLARDLAAAAAANPKTTWCVTVTDADGHAIGHGCARPAPRNERGKRGAPGKHGASGGHDPPGSTGGTRFTFTPDRRDGPPGGWGTWRLATGIPGRPDLIIRLGPISTDPCDHRYQARGHDPMPTTTRLSGAATAMRWDTAATATTAMTPTTAMMVSSMTASIVGDRYAGALAERRCNGREPATLGQLRVSRAPPVMGGANAEIRPARDGRGPA